jgi:alkylation response protein AidB-like acyl-CoA dehydrogenase
VHTGEKYLNCKFLAQHGRLRGSVILAGEAVQDRFAVDPGRPSTAKPLPTTTPIEQPLAAKILEIFEGANELQQWIVARRLIGRDVTG